MDKPMDKPISKRKFTFICSLHGEQELKGVIFAGIELSCGCQVRDIGNKWVFTTKEQRVADEQELVDRNMGLLRARFEKLNSDIEKFEKSQEINNG